MTAEQTTTEPDRRQSAPAANSIPEPGRPRPPEQSRPEVKRAEAAGAEHDRTLIPFDVEQDAAGKPRDINHKISGLENDLAQLKQQLGSINASVEEGLDRLGDNDTDLSAKVSETYKRLGEIDNAYRRLMTISEKLDADILNVNHHVSEVAEKSATGLKSLEQVSVKQAGELGRQHRELASRVDALVEDARITSALLHESIQSNGERLQEAETALLEKIDALAEKTGHQIEDVEQILESSQARMLKMQKVDEAIIRRATTLELTTGELDQKARQMESAIGQLEDGARELTGQVMELMVHVQRLQDESDRHGSLLDEVQSGIATTVQTLTDLGRREMRHFRGLVALLVLIVATMVYFAFDQQAAVRQVVDSQQQAATARQQLATGLQAGRQQLDSELARTRREQQVDADRLTAALAALRQRVEESEAQMSQRLADVGDRLETLDGRVSSSVLVEAIADDNVIHGWQWIGRQPPGNLAIALTVVDSKPALYEIAQRYNGYLQDKLAYLSQQRRGQRVYILFQGSYPTQAQAEAALRRLPERINRHRPRIVRYGALQQGKSQQQ